MQPRFYSEQPITSNNVELRDSEHQHMTKVMRLRVGDHVILFDGSGREFSAAIELIGRQSTQLVIESSSEVDRELPFQLTFGVALPKGDRQQWLVEKLVELGVTRLIPLLTERGVAQPGKKAMTRMKRWIVAASKQSRRNRLMEVTEPKTIEDFGAEVPEAMRLIAHPGEGRSISSFAPLLAVDAACFVAVGPEGGFTDDEVAFARDCGYQQVTLGERILRIETAAIAIASSLVFGERRV